MAAIVCCTAFAPVVAQLPGIHPDPAALEAWQLDEGLERELRQARAAVAEARQSALAAKSELESAVNAKSAAQSQQINDADATSPSQSPQSEALPQDANVAGVKILKRLISELQAERMELLAHLTAEHPLILDADMRLEEYRRQLAGLTSSGPTESSDLASDSRLKIVVEEQRTSETTSTPPEDAPAAPANQSGAEDSLRLEQALAKWEAAQTDLDAALDRESATADRIAAIVARHASNRRKTSAPQTTVQPADVVAVAAAAAATVVIGLGATRLSANRAGRDCDRDIDRGGGLDQAGPRDRSDDLFRRR